ncbi:hypothetical protein DUI87_19967 [Hirundo rustica rustica]|uniref:Uncharacterized protein n=1 Tax=Hirundo rustica rustica TaxID=333673 RepID=A0A3M0JP38_HIRRU|nr:hypothetical protein DUI87_19967 [Hirundo rustica rustica]
MLWKVMLEGMDCSSLRKESDKEKASYELQYPVKFFINMKCLGISDVQMRQDSFLKGDEQPSFMDSVDL